MSAFTAICVSILLGVWVVETVLFVLSYRTSARTEGSRPAERLL
jgi:hypothetical protein